MRFQIGMSKNLPKNYNKKWNLRRYILVAFSMSDKGRPNQSCKIVYPGVSLKIQKIEKKTWKILPNLQIENKNRNFLKILKLKRKSKLIKIPEHLIIMFFVENLKNIDKIMTLTKKHFLNFRKISKFGIILLEICNSYIKTFVNIWK